MNLKSHTSKYIDKQNVKEWKFFGKEHASGVSSHSRVLPLRVCVCLLDEPLDVSENRLQSLFNRQECALQEKEWFQGMRVIQTPRTFFFKNRPISGRQRKSFYYRSRGTKRNESGSPRLLTPSLFLRWGDHWASVVFTSPLAPLTCGGHAER